MAFINGAVPESFEREVTATAAEFERGLRRAWPRKVETLGPRRFRVHDGAEHLDIRVEPLRARRVGLLELPVIAAHYAFSSGDEAARRRLLAALDRAMQRGGG